jgi:hypothetical protein
MWLSRGRLRLGMTCWDNLKEMMMSSRLPTMALDDDILEVLKRLHSRFDGQGHNLAWFVDGDGRVRVLVTVVTEWHETACFDGEEWHQVRVPVARRSTELELPHWEVGALGDEGVVRRIEERIDVTIEPDAALPPRGFEFDRRVA